MRLEYRKLSAFGFLLLVVFPACGTIDTETPASHPPDQPSEVAQPLSVNPTWTPAGPNANRLGGNYDSTGPVLSIAISENYNGPSKPAMFLGTAGGGVWRSTDFTGVAPTWTPVSDGIAVAGAAYIGALAVDPFQPKTIYAGTTGGLYRSKNGGTSWAELGKAVFRDRTFISKIVLNPLVGSAVTGAQEIYVAGGWGGPAAQSNGRRGLQMSTNGGSTFALIGANAILGGVATDLTDGMLITDLEYTIVNQVFTLWVGYTANRANLNGVYRVTNRGANWAATAIPLVDHETGKPPVDGRGNTITVMGGMALVSDHTSGTPNGVYTAVAKTGSPCLLNIYRFDGNNAFTAIGNNHPVKGCINTQDGWNLSLGLSPSGALYFGHVRPEMTANKGATWAAIGIGTNGVNPHVDHHAWAFYGGYVYNGNDGGIWRFTPPANNATAAGAWANLNNGGLQIDSARSLSFNPVDATQLVVGAWHNGILYGTAGGAWSVAFGGDGHLARFDPDPASNGKRAYASTPPDPDPSYIFRTDDFPTTWKTKGFKTYGTKDRVGWNPQFTINPANTKRVLLGLNRLWESDSYGEPGPDNGGVTPGSWKPVSKFFGGGSLEPTAIAYSADGTTIFAAYFENNSVLLFKSADADGSDTDADGNTIRKFTQVGLNVAWRAAIAAIDTDPANPTWVYALTKGSRVFRSRDNGIVWQEITGLQFPAGTGGRVIRVVYGPTAPEPWLLAATRIGVYSALDRGVNTCWRRFGKNLPNADTVDLQLHEATKKLGVAMDGRGVFVIDLPDAPIPKVGIRPVVDVCRAVGVEGTVVTFEALTSGYPDGAKFKWTIVGNAAPILGETGTNPKFKVQTQENGGPLSITLTVRDEFGCPTTSALTWTPFSLLRQQFMADLVCKREAFIQWFPRPLWDPVPFDFLRDPLLGGVAVSVATRPLLATTVRPSTTLAAWDVRNEFRVTYQNATLPTGSLVLVDYRPEANGRFAFLDSADTLAATEVAPGTWAANIALKSDANRGSGKFAGINVAFTAVTPDGDVFFDNGGNAALGCYRADALVCPRCTATSPLSLQPVEVISLP